jgi:hypothetical protein
MRWIWFFWRIGWPIDGALKAYWPAASGARLVYLYFALRAGGFRAFIRGEFLS